MKCNICKCDSNEIFRLTVLGKYIAVYFQCNNCKFIQVGQPFWLEEAYDEAISALDTGILQRNYNSCNNVINIINKNFNALAKFLDYGGGYGIFVRLMRDRGFDFYWYDKFCKNLFAKYFEIKEDLNLIKNKFELITALELFEHLKNPLLEVQKMLSYSDTILFTTELLPENNEKLKDWWYLAPEKLVNIYHSIQNFH